MAEYGQICVKHSHKTDESILAKAIRPSILAQHPRFSVEHVRDTFRFKGVVFSFRDALRFIHAMDQDHSLCPNGLSSDCVAKLDVAKRECAFSTAFEHLIQVLLSFSGDTEGMGVAFPGF